MTPAQESANAKLVSLFIKFGALAFVLFVRAQYAVELQLLGGIWIAQLFPAIVLGLFTRWFHGRALLWGWAAGMATGTGLALARELKSSVFPFQFGGHVYPIYAAIPALLVNLIVSVAVTFAMDRFGAERTADLTQASDYLPVEA